MHIDTCAEFIVNQKKTHLNSLSFLEIDMTQEFNILPRGTQAPIYPAYVLPRPLLSRRRIEPGHEQTWYRIVLLWYLIPCIQIIHTSPWVMEWYKLIIHMKCKSSGGSSIVCRNDLHFFYYSGPLFWEGNCSQNNRILSGEQLMLWQGITQYNGPKRD